MNNFNTFDLNELVVVHGAVSISTHAPANGGTSRFLLASFTHDDCLLNSVEAMMEEEIGVQMLSKLAGLWWFPAVIFNDLEDGMQGLVAKFKKFQDFGTNPKEHYEAVMCLGHYLDYVTDSLIQEKEFALSSGFHRAILTASIDEVPVLCASLVDL